MSQTIKLKLTVYKPSVTFSADYIRGKSAYELALDNGYIGTEQEWIVSLQAKNNLHFDSFLNFPVVGDENKLYIDTQNNKSYRFDSAELKYYIVGSNYEDIQVINGGEANG